MRRGAFHEIGSGMEASGSDDFNHGAKEIG